MGCLNSGQGFDHWFGNIHLSGPCNRNCYFCIGQHMMDLDAYKTLNVHPDQMKGLNKFISECEKRGVKDINITGTNTDPLLFNHIGDLKSRLESELGFFRFGLRTNGALALKYPDRWDYFDKASITVCSFNEPTYQKMMGRGKPPNLEKILERSHFEDIKINVVLGPENIENQDWFETVKKCSHLGIQRINLREPYGQPHVGNPCNSKKEMTRVEDVLGSPTYVFGNTKVTYWDVHYVHVESVNLYANGRVSLDYPITRGHSPKGEVRDQSNFDQGRHCEQWNY